MPEKYCSQCGQELPIVKDTHIVMLMDMSGSMGPQQVEAISAFNSFIKEQREIEGNAFVSLICFDTVLEHPYTHLPLNEVPVLTSDVYAPRGMTALFDAINFGINEFKPSNTEKVIFVIITDGEENSSRKVRSNAEIKRVISLARDNGCEFVFLAADEATFAQGINMGIPVNNAFNYQTVGYGGGTKTMSAAMSSYRTSTLTNTDNFFVSEDNTNDNQVKDGHTIKVTTP